MAREATDEETIEQIVDRLQERFPDRDRAEIEAVARDEYRTLEGRPVRDYLAILVERSTRKRLKKE
ncbi:hypothetical protein ITJ64_15515 [Herbiconiux sp. VKM Ac-1786]|uniref:three-helix bundle dimerization domain-containing protein n=1 Tax=Herbiconiux sp. VKM Ac-1786 TaxID=2783824 RepID=UPI00188D3CEF|nr:hypothetical protein [Herbiconiux sp. VKM Ac-1786]MBF4573923.1 hypothetical protein [Herbiconiux sp. VKM Ac-1786]